MAVYKWRDGDNEIHSNNSGSQSADCGKPEKEHKKNEDSLFSELLGGFHADSDKLLTAALMYLLWKEKADTKLIIALGYILF